MPFAGHRSRRLPKWRVGLRLGFCAALWAMLGVSAAQAQSSCSSDGQPAPTALLERFINAACASCWTAPSRTPSQGQLAIDWIVPSALGDDAALAAAVSRDALERLASLGLAAPATSLNKLHHLKALTATRRPQPRLRVARGIALNGYMGVSVEMNLPGHAAGTTGPFTAWLLLVEEVPAGTEGSQVARLLVRNALVQTWPAASAAGPSRWFESRPMSIPPGANPDRLRAVAWVQSPARHLEAVATSICETQKQ